MHDNSAKDLIKDLIRDLVVLGYNILYLQEDDEYYVVSDFHPSMSNIDVDYIEFEGADITIYIKNWQSQLRDEYERKTKLDSMLDTHQIKHKLNKDTKYRYFSQ
jgi:hypothetical protein